MPVDMMKCGLPSWKSAAGFPFHINYTNWQQSNCPTCATPSNYQQLNTDEYLGFQFKDSERYRRQCSGNGSHNRQIARSAFRPAQEP
jgi:hypothetical protein